MSFDKELRVVMISAIGILAYLIVASAIMATIFVYLGETPFLVAWLVVLLIPLNFALCSFICIIFYRKKERTFNAIKVHLNELSDLAVEVEKNKPMIDKGEDHANMRRAKLSSVSAE